MCTKDLTPGSSRLIGTAMRILGLKPEEVAGMTGKSLVPDTPEAQRRLSEWLDSMERGTATTGTVLELRRKDDGKPVWIQCWSRPAPDGSYTRTMFIDVTDRVLMEREKARLEAQNTYLIEEIKETHNFEEIVGRSRVARSVLEKVRLVARTDSSVLILGETGTGKELVSRAVHSNSARKEPPAGQGELRCASGRAHRERTVRARKGRFHRRDR